MPPALRTRARSPKATRARSLSAAACDKVYAIINKDGKRKVKIIASGLYRPNGVAFKNGTLYIAELSKISKIDKSRTISTPRRSRRDLRKAAER